MALDEQHTAGSGFIESFVSRYPTRILEALLKDRTTGRNIIWADDEYESLGEGYRADCEITVEKITGLSAGVIKPRIAKEQEHQSRRTKSRAEVFTPSWLCNQMNNDVDSVWFGRRNASIPKANSRGRRTEHPWSSPIRRIMAGTPTSQVRAWRSPAARPPSCARATTLSRETSSP